MAKVRKAKYLYQDGVYYEIGGGNEDEILARINNMILVQDDEPTTPYNKIWIKETDTPVEIPEMSDIADFVSFAEDQTARTDAEKAQARVNIGAGKEWTLVWENASPSSAFAAQTVALDLSGYDEFACDYTTNVSGGTPVKRAFARMNERFVLQYFTTDSSKMYPKIRTGEISSTGVAFSDNKQYTTTSNTHNKPYRIYAR